MAKKKPAITAIKGFDKDLKCRDYQFAIGKKFKHEGNVEACKSGFHSVEYPLDVFKYYSPADSRYCEVIASGDISRHDDDSKIASAEIKINAELRMPEIVSKAIAYIMDRVEGDSKIHNTGNYSAASNTGYQSAASNTGDYSAASNTGHQSAASNTGDYSAASNTGHQSAASVEGKASVAMASGYQGKAKACEGSAIVLVNRDDEYNIRHIRASMVGENGIKPGVYYVLDDNGNFVEAG